MEYASTLQGEEKEDISYYLQQSTHTAEHLSERSTSCVVKGEMEHVHTI